MIKDFDEIIKLLDNLTLEKLIIEMENINKRLKKGREKENILLESFYKQLLKVKTTELKLQRIDYEKNKQKIEILLENTIDKRARKDLKKALKLLDEIYDEKFRKILIEA